MGTTYGTSFGTSPNFYGSCDPQAMLRELSLPWLAGERMKTVIDRTSRLARLTYWRTYDIWYGKARRVEPHEIDQIAEALAIKNEKAARNEIHEARILLARVEARLNAINSDFHSAHIDGLRSQASHLGGCNPSKGRVR
jgi:hypothetical protein